MNKVKNFASNKKTQPRTPVLASFPWYDLPSVQRANDLLWRATGYTGQLNRQRSADDLWRDPQLLVTQACGLDLYLADAPIEPVAAPVFSLDCQPGHYYSYIVGNVAGRVAAVNSLSSRSGYSALLSLCNPAEVIVTGSHVDSLAAIRTGSADVAAIDAVTWHILARDRPAYLAGLKIAERSSEAPSPPFVVRRGADHSTLFEALRRAMRSPDTLHARNALFLQDVRPVRMVDYQPVLDEYMGVARSSCEKNSAGK